MIEALRTDYSVRQICEVLGFHRSNLYYAPKIDPYEEVLRAEIETLALRYPTYGYRRIRKLLQRQGHTVGYKRVARLMKDAHLSVAVKRLCQTTTCVEGVHPYVNRLETLEISRCDQVWVGDITYVRLKGYFVYVSLLMDVFTRMNQRVAGESPLDPTADLDALRAGITTAASQRFTIPIRACSIFQIPISQRSPSMGLRFRWRVGDVLGRTDMPKDSSAPSRRKKFTSMTMRILPRRENASVILSNTSITKNAPIRR